MKILVCYASNSGSNFLVAEMLSKILNEKHAVTLKKAADTKLSDFEHHEVILLGSASWSVEKKEGMPLPEMLVLLRSAESKNLSSHSFAFFGCGETTFTYFCGAVDYLEEWLKKVHGKKLCNSLKVDEYYFNLRRNIPMVEGWGREVLKVLNSNL